MLKRVGLFLFSVALFLTAHGDVQVINGVTYECGDDGICRIVDGEDAPTAATEASADGSSVRLAQGYLSEGELLRFLAGEDLLPLSWTLFAGVFAILLGGLAMNLTPCVLPMIPVNLMIVGASFSRGLSYAAGLVVAYGSLGLAAALGGLAFGAIQSNPWFNLAVAVLFLLLAAALSGLFFIDFSKYRTRFARLRTSSLPHLFAFFMGATSAVLAGACVAPVLISVLLLTSAWYAQGHVLALLLPFVFGLGMALPWPFLGLGLHVLPKPGAWMVWVNRVAALFVFLLALWYAHLAVRAWRGEPAADGGHGSSLAATPATFEDLVATLPRPVFVDCWASWCKNCAAMDRVLARESVRKALERFSVVRLQAEDIRELKRLKGFETVQGLPAFVIID